MGLYTTKGLYNKYNKNHLEREKTDYYATPTKEVENILSTLNINFSCQTILEPCCGGGHIIKGINNYLQEKNNHHVNLIATDMYSHPTILDFNYLIGEEYDFISDNYPIIKNIDWIITNPPYSIVEPFTIRALEIAEKGVVMLGRLQFLEGKSRYDNILKENPPSEVYVYVDRINCLKNGKEPNHSSAQSYAWFIWRKENNNKDTIVKWIRRK